MKTVRCSRAFSLIELSIVLALIGLTSVIAAIYVSPSDTRLRTFVRDLRYDLEMAKHEAAARNAVILVTSSLETPLDCNQDGATDASDRCYVVYQDRDGNGAYTAGASPAEDLKFEPIPDSITFLNVDGSGQVWFSPLGGANTRTLRVRTAILRDTDLCTERCSLQSYLFSVTVSGRISIGQKEESTADCTYCGACDDCL